MHLGLGLVSSLKFLESESESNFRLGLEDESGYLHMFSKSNSSSIESN